MRFQARGPVRADVAPFAAHDLTTIGTRVGGPSRRRTGGWVSRWSCPRTYPRLAGLAVGYVRSARENARNDLAQLEHRDEAWRALRRPTLDSQADHKLPRPLRAEERSMPQRTLVKSSANDDAGTHVPRRKAARSVSSATRKCVRPKPGDSSTRIAKATTTAQRS